MNPDVGELRCVTWNVMGLLHELCASRCLERFLHPYDVVCMSHTGREYADCEGDSPSSSLALLAWCPRPVAGNSGGVAVFVRKDKKQLFRMELCRPEMGMVWVSFGRGNDKRMFMLCCYLPPSTSTYYRNPACPDLSDHWGQIQMDVSAFQQEGPVFIAGDLNARTGILNEWDLLDRHIARHEITPTVVGERQSHDRGVNSAGRHLINLCERSHLVMLNGRAVGDREGHWTFRRPSMRNSADSQGCSVIDWWIAPVESFLTLQSKLRMCVIQQPPLRPDGSNFDHRPVCCHVVWNRERRVTQENRADQQSASLRWREEYRGIYTDIMQTDGEVLRMQQMLQGRDTSAEESCTLIQNMVHRAADVLHDRVGGVYKTTSVGGTRTRAQHRGSSWVSDEVRQLQEEVDRIRGQIDAGEQHLGDLIHRLKRLRKRDRKVHIRRKAEQIRYDMLHSPQQFWRRFRGKPRAGSHFSVSEWTRHFRDVFHAGGSTWEGEEQIDTHCAQYPTLFGMPSVDDRAAAEWLNAEFTVEEVETALAAMNLGKAAGPDGIPVEFVRQVYWETRTRGADGRPRVHRQYLLAQPLAVTFNRMLATGYMPEAWTAGLVSPVPKAAGDPSNMQSFRPITVGSALGKIFSHLLLGRLDRWAEAGGWRADTQFGFRADVGTSEATFMLRHVLDKAKAEKKPMCAAFVDFKQAYDSVDRELLWRCLTRMGVHGSCMTIIQNMYANGNLHIKTEEGIGSAFSAEMGVKQGDPLSPLLFGLYMDRVCDFIRSSLPESHIRVGGVSIDCILYADDLVLLAHDRDRLQCLLDALSAFCVATKLRVNVAKTEVVYFNRQWLTHADRTVRYNGNRLTLSTSFVYLGVVFHSSGPKDSAKHALKRRLDKARGALFAMMGTCHNMKVFDVCVLNKLFDTLCLPSLMYGVEQWGPEMLTGTMQSGMDLKELEGLHATFMRMTLWVKKSTPLNCMRQELQRCPISMHCIHKCAGFWNKLARGSEDSLTHRCWAENISLGEGSWSHKLCDLRSRSMGGDWVAPPSNVWDVQQLNNQLLAVLHDYVSNGYRECMDATRDMAVGGSRVRACPDDVRSGFKSFKYSLWFDTTQKVTPVIQQVHEAGNIRVLAKFRCGAHRLECEVGRSANPRSNRLCNFCDTGEVEDELHVLICPAWQGIRDECPDLFDTSVYNALVRAVEDEGEVDACFCHFVNPSAPYMVQLLAGYLKKVFAARLL